MPQAKSAGLTEVVAQFINTASLQAMPEGTVECAKRVIADTFAVILAGAGSEVTEPLLKYVAQSGQGGSVPIFGTGIVTAPEIAAMVNGTFGHALDFDDVLSIMPAHPSAVILAALTASMGNMKVSGDRLIEAYVIGIEVGAKIGVAMTVGHYDKGFHGTGTLAIFSALAALAKLHGLDVATMRTAFGIASSMASGVRRNFGTMTKPLHTGWAARSALAATALARCGFSAAPDVLEATAGFFEAYGVEASDPAIAAASLGKPWTMLDPGIALKRFPCCYASHRGMDGALILREKLNFNAASLKRLVCHMPPGGMRVLTYPTPKTGLEGKFSLEYSLAAGVLDGAYTLWSFTDEAVNRPEINALYKKIEIMEDPHCANHDDFLHTQSSGSRGFVEVEVELMDGRKDRARVDHAPGHPKRALSRDSLHAKFLDCASHSAVRPEQAEQAFEYLVKLETQTDVRDIFGLLTS